VVTDRNIQKKILIYLQLCNFVSINVQQDATTHSLFYL